MNDIKCVQFEKVSSTIFNYLFELIKEVGFEAKFVDGLNTSTLNHGPLVIIASKEHLPLLKDILKKCQNKILIALNSRKDFKLVLELKNDLNKVFGFIDLTQEKEYNIPLLSNYLKSNFNNLWHLDNVVESLDKAYEVTKSELLKIKNLHDRFVKIRTDQVKGITVKSKFMAGEKSGGEFFEIIQGHQEMVLLQVGSDSYLLSSMILSELELIKESSDHKNWQEKINIFQNKISQYAKDKNAAFTFFSMIINLKTLQAKIEGTGLGQLFFNDSFFKISDLSVVNLKPQERFCFISEGAMRNWDFLTKISLETFFNNNKLEPTKELINEFFFEVSRHKAGTFLIYDALMMVVEIEENVLYQLPKS